MGHHLFIVLKRFTKVGMQLVLNGLQFEHVDVCVIKMFCERIFYYCVPVYLYIGLPLKIGVWTICVNKKKIKMLKQCIDLTLFTNEEKSFTNKNVYRIYKICKRGVTNTLRGGEREGNEPVNFI